MKKIIAFIILVLLTTTVFSQTKTKLQLFNEAKAQEVMGRGSWRDTEYGTLYLHSLDSLERKYSGRLEGEIFKMEKKKLEEAYFIPELEETHRIFTRAREIVKEHGGSPSNP